MMIFWLVAGLLAGLILGLLHFGGLWRTVQELEPGGDELKRLFMSALIRFAITGFGLWGLAMLNPLAMLSAMAGILIARRVIRRRVLRAGEA